jgi:hypothetical protein
LYGWINLVYPEKTMGRCFRGTRPMGEPRARWVAAVWKVAVDLLKIQKWKVEPRKLGRGDVFS